VAHGQNYQAIVQGVQAVVELAVATGLVPLAIRWFQSKGVDIVAVKNSTAVQAAYRAALSGLQEYKTNGYNIHDPAIVQKVVESAAASLSATHAQTLASIGANIDDVDRIAKQQTHAALTDIAASTPAPAAPAASAQ